MLTPAIITSCKIDSPKKMIHVSLTVLTTAIEFEKAFLINANYDDKSWQI